MCGAISAHGQSAQPAHIIEALNGVDERRLQVVSATSGLYNTVNVQRHLISARTHRALPVPASSHENISRLPVTRVSHCRVNHLPRLTLPGTRRRCRFGFEATVIWRMLVNRPGWRANWRAIRLRFGDARW
jgi:hypothetical protein